MSSDVAIASAPAGWEADVVLRDGSLAHVRPISPDDTEAIRRFHDAQSEESIYLRFFAPIKQLSDRDVHRFTHVDHDRRVALVVVLGDDIIGIGRYDRLDDPSVAEVAFNISDHHQGKGIGSVLLEHLAAIGQEAGVTKFVADVLPQNRKMMKVFSDAGYEIKHHFDDGVIAVEFRIESTDKSQAVQLAREHRSEAQSMTRVLAPASVAIVGASRRPDALGSVALDNIVDAGYAGRVYVVHAEAEQLRGLPAYRTVRDIGEPVDLAVIAVPAEGILDVVDDCAAAGVHTLLVLTTGFAEAGPEGERLQGELLARARAHGMRVVGPGSFGLVNNDPQVRLHATISRELPPEGTVGLFSQSGGLGVGLLAAASRRRLGVSEFLSAGNRVDVSGNDIMQFWIDDESTKAVGIYLESVGNARKFSRIARQLSLRKPVVCVKSPTSGTVPPGHRARAARVDRSAFDAMLRQAGVIQARTIRELVQICELVSRQPLPQGDRVAIIGNSPGFNAISAESAAAEGLTVTHGPVHLPVEATARQVAQALEAAFADDDVDSVSVCLVAPLGSAEEDVAGAIAHVSWGQEKPCLTSFLGTRDVSPVMRRASRMVGDDPTDRRVVPVNDSPMEAMAALGAATRYANWRRADRGERMRPSGIDRGAVHRMMQRILDESPDGRELDEPETRELLAAYGIDLWPTVPVTTADEAVEAADRLGYPVVVKTMIESVRARPGAGGVSADLGGESAVRDAFATLSRRFSVFGNPRLAVQRMASPGVPMVLSSTEDPLFGPVVSLGIAGVPSELLGDVVHAIPPLTDVDISTLFSSLKAAPLLRGYRGSAPVDRAALTDLVARVAALADEVPEVASLELDFVNAHAEGAEVLGATARVAPASTRTDAGRRSLR